MYLAQQDRFHLSLVLSRTENKEVELKKGGLVSFHFFRYVNTKSTMIKSKIAVRINARITFMEK